jgi:uncharacterized repeat protein (TIGR01451 family)
LQRCARGFARPVLSLYSVNRLMGSFRLRQGPQQRRLAGISLRSTLLGLVLGVGLLAAAPSAASAAADLSIAKTAPGNVLVGDQFTYDLTIQNKDPVGEATGAQVTDALPAGVTFVSATAGCSESSGTVTCALGPLPSSQSTTARITVRATTTGAVTNTATVSIPTDPTPDPTPDDNSSSAQTTVSPVAGLVLTMIDVPDPVVAGELLTYTITVHNDGPSDATAVRVTDTLPAGVTFEAATTPDCSPPSDTVTCDLAILPSGQSATWNITVRPLSAGSITNQATVSSPVTDRDPADNSWSVDTTVSPAPPSSGGQAGDGSPKTGPLNVVLTNSYVLISGRSVKLVKGKFVPVKLTCAGQRKCEGTITVTTAKPVATSRKHRKRKKQKRRIARLGSKRFSIEGNRQQKVLVPLTKSKVKLLRRLKRVKAKAAIREIDLKGNPRISTRTFTLRAR